MYPALAALVVEVYRRVGGVRMPVPQNVAQRCNESRNIWKDIKSGQTPGMHKRLQTMVRARVPAFDLAAFIASLGPCGTVVETEEEEGDARRAGRSEDALLPTAAPKRPLADGGLGGRSKMKKRDGPGGDVRPTTSNPNTAALASDYNRWQLKAPPPKAPPSPIGKSPSASASVASSSAPPSARLSAPSEAVKNSLPPHRRVSRRLKAEGVAKDRFTQARIESALAATGGDVDEAVAQLVAEAAGKGGGSEVFILSSSDED